MSRYRSLGVARSNHSNNSHQGIDPDNLIPLGAPEWSQKVDLVAADPIIGYDNIAYTFHFYTV